MTVTLKPGDLGSDMSGFRLDTATKVNQFHAAGGKFVLRYSAGAASNTGDPNHASVAWKLITPAEYHHIITEVGDIIANDEWYESRMTEGAKAGTPDGHAAGALWHSCGLPKGAAIYSSWDAAPVSSKWPAVDAYCRAYRTAISTWGYTLGAYAGTPYLRHAFSGKLLRFGWRPNAGSWSNDGIAYQPDTSTPAKRDAFFKAALCRTPAHIIQTGNYWFNKNCDENMILRVPVGSHFQALAPKPAPTPAPKPTPQPAAPHYPVPSPAPASFLVHKDRAWAWYPMNDGSGRIEVRHNGVHYGYITTTK